MIRVVLTITYVHLLFYSAMALAAWLQLWRIDRIRVGRGEKPQCHDWTERLFWAWLWPILVGLTLGGWSVKPVLAAMDLYEKLTAKTKRL